MERSDCGVSQACYPHEHSCRARCTSNAGCPGDAPLCDPVASARVGCRDDADCPATRSICDPRRAQRSHCASNGDCGAAAPACDLIDDERRRCLVDVDCPNGYLCATIASATPVARSTASASAVGTRATAVRRPFCGPSGRCVQCTEVEGCGAAAPFCSVDGSCVQCVTNAQCASPLPACHAARCVQRGDGFDCPSGEKCNDDVCVPH